MNARFWIVTGAVLAAVGVAAGSFGAHGLQQLLAANVPSDVEPESFVTKRLDQFETAVRYHVYHALALLAVGLLRARAASKCLNAAGICFLLGVILFSGMLYALVLTDSPRLGMVVPIGGAAFIVGWVLLAVAGSRLPAFEAA